jgi:hypothetical protein
MTHEEIVLDCLADDCESIEQISNWFKFLNVFITSDELKKLIINLLTEGKICTIGDDRQWVVDTDNPPVLDGYWFKMTTRGRSQWNAIEDLQNKPPSE